MHLSMLQVPFHSFYTLAYLFKYITVYFLYYYATGHEGDAFVCMTPLDSKNGAGEFISNAIEVIDYSTGISNHSKLVYVRFKPLLPVFDVN
jgi:hypothetical protein